MKIGRFFQGLCISEPPISEADAVKHKQMVARELDWSAAEFVLQRREKMLAERAALEQQFGVGVVLVWNEIVSEYHTRLDPHWSKSQ